MSRPRRYAWALLPLLALVLASRVLVPAAPRVLDPSSTAGVWAGALHVHTTRSDGSGTPEDVADAAARAGLSFVILSDHGDGTREPLPPVYRSGVLLVDGVEISTADGHYLAIGLPRAPYRLAGEGRDVADDVARLGGVGVIAHPDSKRTSLAWHDPHTRGDGMEVLNADSAWRDEGAWSLLRRLLPYPWRPAATLASTLSYPGALLASLDAPEPGAPRLALAGVDAHARIGLRPGDEPMGSARTLARLPAYTASFGTFGMAMSWPSGHGPTGDPHRDAAALLEAVRTHALHVAVFALADAAPLSFGARSVEGWHRPGARVPSGDAVTLTAAVPPIDGVRLRLLRNGLPWRDVSASTIDGFVPAGAPAAVYRAEAWLPRRWQQPELPWMVSQAVAVGLPEAVDPASRSRPAALPAGTTLAGPWHVEHDRTSTATVLPRADGGVDVLTALGPGTRASQFAAAAVGWPTGVSRATHLTFTAAAGRPMRLSVQLRAPADEAGRRWVRSVYLDQRPRQIVVALDDMRAVAPASGRVPVEHLHALLLVVDTVNAQPGDRHAFTVESLQVP